MATASHSASSAKTSDPLAADRGAIHAIRTATGRGLLAAWFILVLALAGPSLSAFQSTVVSPLGSTLARHFGGGDAGAMIAQLGLTIPAIGVMIGGPLTAALISRCGYRVVIVASALLMAIAGALGGVIDNVPLFLVSRFIVGLTAVALYSSLVALCGVLFTGKTLGRMISYQNGISALISMVLVLVSGWVASRVGWQFSFLIYLPIALFAVLALLAWLPPKSERRTKTRGGYASLKPLVPLYLITIGVFAVVFIVIVQGSLLLSANGIQDPSLQSVVIAASTIAYAVTATACSWIQTHWTRQWTFTASLALLAAGTLTMSLIPQVGGAMLGSLLIGAGSGISASYLTTLVIERAPEGAREQAVGLIAPAHYVGQFANPFIMQSLAISVGIQSAFTIVGVVLGVTAVTAALLQARSTRQPAANTALAAAPIEQRTDPLQP